MLHHRRAAGLDQFRVDVADLGWAPERAELAVQVGETIVDLAAGRSRRCRWSTSRRTR